MAKGKRSKKGGGKKMVVYDSDDERSYAKEKTPDPTSSDFYHDEIDDFHSNREKILLDRGAAVEHAGMSSDEEEGVLDLDSDDSDDEEMQTYKKQIRHFSTQSLKHKLGSDVEDEEEELLDDKAWGQKRKQFYGADVDADIEVGSDVEASAAALEEQEALAIQQRLAQQLDDADFGLDIFTAPEPEQAGEEPRDQEGHKIEKDLSTLSKKEKMKLLKKESPELLELIDDYKRKMTEVAEKLIPIQKQIRQGSLPRDSPAAGYVESKLALNLNYCVNISFYMMLKAKKAPVHNHPVITRLLQHRNLLKQLESADEKMAPLLEETLRRVASGETLVEETTPSRAARAKKRAAKKRKLSDSDAAAAVQGKRLSQLLDDEESSDEEAKSTAAKPQKRRRDDLTDAEKDALKNYALLKGGRHDATGVEESDNEEEDGEEGGEQQEGDEDEYDEDGEGEEEDWGEEGKKRPINYQIAKNKGLTPGKKKENRNPRVKHRRKFRRALIRRKGQVRPVRTETTRYGGELSGIRAGRIASRKLK